MASRVRTASFGVPLRVRVRVAAFGSAVVAFLTPSEPVTLSFLLLILGSVTVPDFFSSAPNEEDEEGEYPDMDLR